MTTIEDLLRRPSSSGLHSAQQQLPSSRKTYSLGDHLASQADCVRDVSSDDVKRSVRTGSSRAPGSPVASDRTERRPCSIAMPPPLGPG
jgi:hypothetical protein